MKRYQKKKLPVGIEDFKKLREEDFFYVDKTGLIRDLLCNWGEVNLFTRPRRFGKSLNMSMLQNFFEIGCSQDIFEGLKIAQENELCEAYQGKFPVIFISLKGIHAASFHASYSMAVRTITAEASRFQYLLDSERLTDHDKKVFEDLLKNDMDEPAFCDSLKTLSRLLYKHHNQKVILLIDEYDVPLQKAFELGYYDPMVNLIRNFLGQVLKTNPSLQFAVLTGCMRISKESIFTGLNNLSVSSIADVEYDEYFGFTDNEVKTMLTYYGISEKYEEMKEWYDGYRFGNVGVYCPWDVLSHCRKLRTDIDTKPQGYWNNTSSNDVVKQFIRSSGTDTQKNEIERLVAGESILKEIRQDLTYRDMYQSIENLWSILFTTGYLTHRGNPEEDLFYLAIPNLEIRKIFTKQILELFRENAKEDGKALDAFCMALQSGDAADVQRHFEEYLKKTISIRDTFVQKPLKENFYHGILLGLLGFRADWTVSSNKESGDGYSDILVNVNRGEMGIVIEMKYASDSNLEKESQKALTQINKNRYYQALHDDGIKTILKYGIACHKNQCKVQLEVSSSAVV